MEHVFVSYSQPDRDCAFELVSRIEAHGIDAWIAPRDIAPSAEWAAEIIDAIAAAWIMVLVFSSHSNESPQVRREVERAVHKQVPILPFRIESVTPSKSLEYFLSAQHWLDAFPPPLEPHYARLCSMLSSSRRGGARSASAAFAADMGNPAATLGPAATLPLSTPAALAAGVALGEEELRRLERALAYHVGPIARALVRRTAARVQDREALLRSLAGEIDSASDRQRFIADWRASERSSTR
jgi:hypothetical protein